MATQDVRIIRLAPMRVVAATGYGEEPELIAWQKIKDYIAVNGLDINKQRFFGFNNPSPSPGSPNYGYEQWMVVDDEAEADGDLEIKRFAGGLYAVLACNSLHTIGADWKRLVVWVEDSPYQIGNRECLEECFTPEAVEPDDFRFDLYLSLAE